MTYWHHLQTEKIIEALDTNPQTGLSQDEVEIRQKNIGLNKLPEEKSLPQVKIFLDQFKSPLIYILVIAGIITLILGHSADTIVIFGAVFLNTIVGYLQEKKASQSLRALKKVLKVKAIVIREGKKKEILQEDLVSGDIIILHPGDKVPADGRLIMASNLKINEASLTGEWLSASKTVKVLSKETPLADRDNMVYMGGIIESGSGKAIVTGTGIETEIGKVAVLIKETKEEKTPFQQKLAQFSKVIGIICALLCFLIFIQGIVSGREFIEMFFIAVAVGVAAIPEGLPVAMTVILSIGMERVLKKKGLVRKLVAAETLGGASVIATDKTLTLTEGKMEVSEIKSTNKRLALKIVVLANEAFIENPQDLPSFWQVRGRPTDRALLLAGVKEGITKQELEKKFLKIDEIPFNSHAKFIAKLYQTSEKQHLLYVSGAPEKILELSLKKLSKQKLKELQEELNRMTGKGLRVVAVAYKNLPYSAWQNLDSSGIKKIKKNNEEVNLKDKMEDLTFAGFIGLKDPVRKEAKEAINLCKKAGIKPIIVTGDHLLTAQAVALELGFKIKAKNIIEGQDLDKLSDSELQKRLKTLEIYARVEPRHKLRIIQAWQEKGEVIAMTGDGINDAPALKQADIGVAIGSGTAVAQEVSDLVLLTDNFNIIVAAVEEGRAIIDNIRKVITYLLSDSFTETILIGVSIILGLPLPIIAVQILYVNLIEDGLPSIALAFEPKEKDLMARKPQGKNIPLLTREMKALIFIIGFFTDLILLGLFLWLLKGEYSVQHIQTMIFACLSIDSLFYVFSCKSLRRNIWHINPFSNKFLFFAWLFGVMMLLSAIYLPPLQTLLRTVPLNFSDWCIILSLGLLNIILIEATKWHFIVKNIKL